MSDYDAVVIGAGPNGLAAAIELARAGRSVLVREGAESIGGGLRSGELTLPGFVHDLCSAIHPLAAALPVLPHAPAREARARMDRAAASRSPIRSTTASAAVLRRSVEETAESARRSTQTRYREPVRAAGRRLGPARVFACSDRSCGLRATHSRWRASASRRLQPAARLRPETLSTREPARALFAGTRGPLDPAARAVAGSASFGLVLGTTGHAVGLAASSRRLAARSRTRSPRYLRSLGGEIETGAPVVSLDELSAPGASCST